MNRIEAIKAGLSKNYPMYWTGPRYQVPDADLRDLLAVADAAIGVMCDSSEPVENMSSAGWEGVSLCNYGMLKRLTLALAPLLMEVEKK